MKSLIMAVVVAVLLSGCAGMRQRFLTAKMKTMRIDISRLSDISLFVR